MCPISEGKTSTPVLNSSEESAILNIVVATRIHLNMQAYLKTEKVYNLKLILRLWGSCSIEYSWYHFNKGHR